MFRLTEPGCCVQPFWSPDGQEVRFIDRPEPTSPTGIYGVSVEGGTVHLVSERIGLPSPDGRYLAYLDEQGKTVVEDTANDQRWTIPNGGRRVFFSPNSIRLAWAAIFDTGTFDQQRVVVSISDLDGSNAREVATVYGGGIAGWLDDEHLLLAGRDTPQDDEMALFSLSIVDGSTQVLVRNHNIRSASIAPGGEWILYTITLNTDQPEDNGMWIIRADGGLHYRLEAVGSARWRDGSHLLIIPMELDAPSYRIWQFDAETGQVTPLTDPQQLSFRVQAGDWSVSPTGEFVVFVNAEDQALWLIILPPL
jgi:Tol biopolymer transport system component